MSKAPQVKTHQASLEECRRIIIKIGSSLLLDKKTGKVNMPWLHSVAQDIAAWHGQGREIAIVSSGAVALGRRSLNLHTGTLKLEESQAAAAAGQIHLAHAYEEALRPHNITIGQILLTLSDTEERRRYLNARSTLETLFSVGAVPIINENDTISTTEIRYGDNDRLAARVAQMVSADCLVLLSDIDGLYTDDPTTNKDAKLIPIVRKMTPEIDAMAGKVSPLDAMRLGSGGMVTKLMAARICLPAGCRMVIANGHQTNPIKAVEAGATCTWFLPEDTPLDARKQWIAGALSPKGVFHIDDGAARALALGKSLLPVGVTKVDGDFERGDAVIIQSKNGDELARGLSAYCTQDARKIIGHKSSDIETLLGYSGRMAIVHADDLVLRAQ